MSSLSLDRLCPKIPALLVSQPSISPALVVPRSTSCDYSVRTSVLVCDSRCSTADSRVPDVGIVTSTGGGVGTFQPSSQTLGCVTLCVEPRTSSAGDQPGRDQLIEQHVQFMVVHGSHIVEVGRPVVRLTE